MALVAENGTPVAKEPGAGLLEPVTEPDPRFKVKATVYRRTPYHLTRVHMRQVAFHAGQIIRRSEWNAEFTVPEIVSIAPAAGPAAGGTRVKMRGYNFTEDVKVTVGGANATGLTVASLEELEFTAPAGTAGAANVVVTTAGGAATAEGGFTYAAPDPEPEPEEG